MTRKWLAQWHQRSQWLLFYTGGYAGIAVAVLVFYNSIPLSMACGAAIIFFKGRYRKYLEKRRHKELEAAFRDFLHSMSASLSTGRQLEAAIDEARENLSHIYKKDSPMMEELDLMAKAFTDTRCREGEALINFAARSGIAEIRDFVELYLVCRETGGNLVRVIADASRILMDKMESEREIRVLTVQKQLEGKIISVMPLVIILFMQITSPDYLQPLYSTQTGRFIMTIALAGIAASYQLTQQMTKIEV